MTKPETPAPGTGARSLFRPTTFLTRTLLCLACLAVLFLVIDRALAMTMKNRARENAQSILARYRQVYRHGGLAALQSTFPDNGVHGMIFLRLSGPRVRLVLMSTMRHDSRLHVPDFDTFPPTMEKTWSSLRSADHLGRWTIASSRLADSNVLQIGIDSTDSIRLFARLEKTVLLCAIMFAPLSLVPGLCLTRQQKTQTDALYSIIEQAAQGHLADLSRLPATTADDQRLVEAVNRLLTRHRQLTRELQESMDNVAHDLRTPMTRLRTIAEYGLQEQKDIKQLRETLADCLEESDRVLAMLNTMLTVAEVEADSVDLKLGPVDLREIVSEVMDLYQVLAEEKNITMTRDAPQPVMALVDRTRISQVWANLLDNAIKYGADRIDISLCRQGSMAVGTITDNGIGISATEIDRIWDRLYRGDRSRNRPGIGLGLTLVRAVVAVHHGTVEVSSKLNRGTTFTVRLPAA